MRHRIGDFAQCWQGFDRIVALPEPKPQPGVDFRRALEGLSPGLGSAPEAARGVPCVCSGAARSEPSQKGIAAAVRIRLKNQSFAERRFPTGKVRVSGHRTGCHDSGQRPCGNGRKPASEARTDTGFHVALCSFVGIDPKPVVRNRPSFGKRGVRECPARERANSGKPLRFDVSICSQAYLWGLLRHMESAACPRFRHAVRIPSFRGRRFTYAVPSERTHFAPLDVQSGKGP